VFAAGVPELALQGLVSLVQGGRLTRYRNVDELVQQLRPLFSQKTSSFGDLLQWRK